MICIDTQYLRFNRILLILIGLWPYQQSKLDRFQLIFCFSVLTSFIIFQITKFITADCTIDLSIKIFSSVLFFAMFMITYISFCVNTQTVKCLLEQLQRIYNELKDENEIAIIKKYGCYAKQYTIRFILLTIIGEFIITSMPIWPYILDVLQPINESHPQHTVKILTEYFIDQEKYVYLILLHMNAAILIGGIVLIATGTMLLVYLKYACGMFRIASYRIKQAMKINIIQKCQQNDTLIYKKIIYAIDIHRKALKYAEYLIVSFEGSFFSLIAVSVSCLSLNLVRIFQITTLDIDIDELLLHFVVVITIILYMFFANYAGQEITDHNNDVFSAAYNVQWYTAPLNIQKLILFLLQRGNKTFSLNVGGMFAASLRCFASLTSASISYFTMMYSTQQ